MALLLNLLVVAILAALVWRAVRDDAPEPMDHPYRDDTKRGDDA